MELYCSGFSFSATTIDDMDSFLWLNATSFLLATPGSFFADDSSVSKRTAPFDASIFGEDVFEGTFLAFGEPVSTEAESGSCLSPLLSRFIFLSGSSSRESRLCL